MIRPSARVDQAFQIRDEGKRQEAIRAMTRDIVAQAPYIWLPTLRIHRLVAVGQELRRRTARRRRA
jgi:hypothetical protein